MTISCVIDCCRRCGEYRENIYQEMSLSLCVPIDCSRGVSNEDVSKCDDGSLPAGGLHQQQQSAAAERNHRGGAGGIDDNGRLPGWSGTALLRGGFAS
jgi:hypothetical protein